MIAMAGALACVSAFAVESANVVGYAQSALKSGNTAAGAQFVPMTDDSIDLANLTVVGYEEEQGGDIYVQRVDGKGKMIAGSQYFWYDIPDDSLYGWYDGSDEPLVAGTQTVKVGEGWWIKGTATTEGIQSSGQVANAPIQVNLMNGNKFIVNPTPVAVNFNDDDNNGKFIAVGGYTEEQGGDIYVQQVDGKGKMVAGTQYFWYDIPADELYGWYDGNDDPITGISLPAGGALWVKGTSTDEYISFPSAL